MPRSSACCSRERPAQHVLLLGQQAQRRRRTPPAARGGSPWASQSQIRAGSATSFTQRSAARGSAGSAQQRERQPPPVDELEPGGDALVLGVARRRGRPPVGAGDEPPVGGRAVQPGPLDSADRIQVRRTGRVDRTPGREGRLAGEVAELGLVVDVRPVQHESHRRQQPAPQSLPAPPYPGCSGPAGGRGDDDEIDVREPRHEVGAARAATEVDAGAPLAARQVPGAGPGDTEVGELDRPPGPRPPGAQQQPLSGEGHR